MKKSQLRNIIRQVIREQIDVEKNKLRPIKPEKPPKPLNTPNCYDTVEIEICEITNPAFTSYTNSDIGTAHWIMVGQNGGFTCNGFANMCTTNDLNQTFTVASHGIKGKLLTLGNPHTSSFKSNLVSSTCPPPPDPCDTYNSWPISTAIPNANPFVGPHAPGLAAGDPFPGQGGNITTGFLEFMMQHGATIANGIPVSSQWFLGGPSLYYPSQADYCEMCIQDPNHSSPAWTTPATSPIGTTNWLMDEGPGACGCCPS